MADDTTYGFNRQDADAILLRLAPEAQILKRDMPRGSGSSSRIYRTPSGGIPARSGSTLGSATCTLVTVANGTRAVGTDTETIYNNFLSAIGNSVDVVVTRVDGIWIVIAEDCT